MTSKKDEPGLLALCERQGWPLENLLRGRAAAGAGEFTPSAFVAETVGVDNVCERAAVCAAAGGRLLCRKTARDGVTVALAARNSACGLTDKRTKRIITGGLLLWTCV